VVWIVSDRYERGNTSDIDRKKKSARRKTISHNRDRETILSNLIDSDYFNDVSIDISNMLEVFWSISDYIY
jgi:hypothetical protein